MTGGDMSRVEYLLCIKWACAKHIIWSKSDSRIRVRILNNHNSQDYQRMLIPRDYPFLRVNVWAHVGKDSINIVDIKTVR